MTVQQLKYIIVTAEKGSITEAAKALYLSQPSLSGAIKDVEKAAGITVFNRCHTGVVPTKEGLEFLGYARQVLQQMELLEAKYMGSEAPKQRFCVSTQHYTFTTNAFVELLQRFGQERYEFILNETQTHQILEDVRNRYCATWVFSSSARATRRSCAKSLTNMIWNFMSFFRRFPIYLSVADTPSPSEPRSLCRIWPRIPG
jgi:DNA-binding transcriptional LysR family regulator